MITYIGGLRCLRCYIVG